MGQPSQGWLPTGGVVSQRLIGTFLLLTFLMMGVSLIFLEDLRVSLRQVLTGSSAALGVGIDHLRHSTAGECPAMQQAQSTCQLLQRVSGTL